MCNAALRMRSISRLYPIALFSLLVVLLLYLYLFAPVTLTLDGYGHLYEGEALEWMLRGVPEVRSTFYYNSLLLPNWLCTLALAALSSIVSSELALKLLGRVLINPNDLVGRGPRGWDLAHPRMERKRKAPSAWVASRARRNYGQILRYSTYLTGARYSGARLLLPRNFAAL